MCFKSILKLFIPPIIIKLFKSPGKRQIEKQGVQFQKTNLSWDEAIKQTSHGYSNELILNKCKDSLLKVKNGEYPYERDSVLFSEIELFYPLLASLLYVSLRNNKKLNIIDFGGSLGSTYFQNKDILKQAGVAINWNIIEQENFVKCGKEYFENDELHFYYAIDEIRNNDISVCLFSSVLPYLKEQYAIIEKITRRNVRYIIIDRTYFLDEESENTLAIQKVPTEIYSASYPAWFFSLEKFLGYIKEYYLIKYKWNNSDAITITGLKTSIRGFFLEKMNK